MKRRNKDKDSETDAEAITEHEIRATICREHRRGLSNRAIAGGISTIFQKHITVDRVQKVLDDDLKILHKIPQDVLEAAFPSVPNDQLPVAAKDLDLKEALRKTREEHLEKVIDRYSILSSPGNGSVSNNDSFENSGESREVAEEDIQPHIKQQLAMPNDALRYHVFTLRKQGKSYPEIQAETGVDHKVARRWVSDELAVLDIDEFSNRNLAKRMQLERTEALMAAIWPSATRQPTPEFPNQGPDLEATRTALRILERQSKLLGLDSPPKVDIEERVRLIARKNGIDEDEMVSYAVEAIKHKSLPSH